MNGKKAKKLRKKSKQLIEAGEKVEEKEDSEVIQGSSSP